MFTICKLKTRNIAQEIINVWDIETDMADSQIHTVKQSVLRGFTE